MNERHVRLRRGASRADIAHASGVSELHAAGAECQEQNECAHDLVCRDHTCAPYADDGGTCRIDGATIPLDTGCIGSLECSPDTLTCVPPTMGELKGPGAPCGRSLVQVDDCYNGAYLCVESKKLLCPLRKPAEGSECSSSVGCDAVSLCVDGICQPLTTAACNASAALQ